MFLVQVLRVNLCPSLKIVSDNEVSETESIFAGSENP